MRRSWAAAAAVLVASAGCADLPGDAARGRTIEGRITEVVDGDTIRVAAGGREYRVRLIGIDTPETRHPARPVECGGPQATAALAPFEGRRVTLRTDPGQDTFDRYDRLLAYASADGVSLQERQLRAGWARVYVYDDRPFARVGAYRAAERDARDARRGIWGRCR